MIFCGWEQLAGNEACMADVIRICSRYDNLKTLEEGYGINIRPLSTFAINTYNDDDCKNFMPKIYEYNKYTNSDQNTIAKIHKAIAIIQFKLEGNLLLGHPEYNMQKRLLLDKVDYKKGIIIIDGKLYELNDNNFPTIDKTNPYKLSEEEEEVVERLKESFIHSEKLKSHITLLYLKGSVYKIFNSNLLFHGCIPINDDGTFREVNIFGRNLKGKEYLDYIEKVIHKAYFKKGDNESNQEYIDYMWVLWCSEDSPFFGKDKAATYERYFIEEEEAKLETKSPYFKLIEQEETCNKILGEFGLNIEKSHIVNGHMPVKARKGETPIKANGKLLVIDGGFAKSYQKQTGEAGYTLTYNSYGLLLAANKPFCSKMQAIESEYDLQSEIVVNSTGVVRKMVEDTDVGIKLKKEIDDLKMLLNAYREGLIKQKG